MTPNGRLQLTRNSSSQSIRGTVRAADAVPQRWQSALLGAAEPHVRYTARKHLMGEYLELVPYDPNWPLEFESERDRLAAALGDLAIRIDHNGSTAVPGLAAKPVIDIQISVRQLHPIETYAPHLVQLGYQHRPHEDDAFCPFFYRPSCWPHTHHVHVVQAEGEEERRTLAFRDYLRDHSTAAHEYEGLKRRLAPHFDAAAFPSRQAYADAKADFINQITQLALAEGYPRDLKHTV